MDKDQFNALITRLDAILKILALGLPEDLTAQDKIVKLKETGLTAAQIAQVLGTSPGYVSVALDRARKKQPAKAVRPPALAPSEEPSP